MKEGPSSGGCGSVISAVTRSPPTGQPPGRNTDHLLPLVAVPHPFNLVIQQGMRGNNLH